MGGGRHASLSRLKGSAWVLWWQLRGSRAGGLLPEAGAEGHPTAPDPSLHSACLRARGHLEGLCQADPPGCSLAGVAHFKSPSAIAHLCQPLPSSLAGLLAALPAWLLEGPQEGSLTCCFQPRPCSFPTMPPVPLASLPELQMMGDASSRCCSGGE